MDLQALEVLFVVELAADRPPDPALPVHLEGVPGDPGVGTNPPVLSLGAGHLAVVLLHQHQVELLDEASVRGDEDPGGLLLITRQRQDLLP